MIRRYLLEEAVLPAPPATVALALGQIGESAAVRRWRVYIFTGFGLADIVAVCKRVAPGPVAIEERAVPGLDAGRIVGTGGIIAVCLAVAIVIDTVGAAGFGWIARRRRVANIGTEEARIVS